MAAPANNLQAVDALTVHTAKAVLALGVAAINAGQDALDLGAVQTVDSAAVAVLLAWRRAARAKGKSLRFINLPESLASLSTLYGVDELLFGAQPANLQHH